jgi:hypothetical protein
VRIKETNSFNLLIEATSPTIAEQCYSPDPQVLSIFEVNSGILLLAKLIASATAGR